MIASNLSEVEAKVFYNHVTELRRQKGKQDLSVDALNSVAEFIRMQNGAKLQSKPRSRKTREAKMVVKSEERSSLGPPTKRRKNDDENDEDSEEPDDDDEEDADYSANENSTDAAEDHVLKGVICDDDLDLDGNSNGEGEDEVDDDDDDDDGGIKESDESLDVEEEEANDDDQGNRYDSKKSRDADTGDVGCIEITKTRSFNRLRGGGGIRGGPGRGRIGARGSGRGRGGRVGGKRGPNGRNGGRT
jgi:hypothetical protein